MYYNGYKVGGLPWQWQKTTNLLAVGPNHEMHLEWYLAVYEEPGEGSEYHPDHVVYLNTEMTLNNTNQEKLSIVSSST